MVRSTDRKRLIKEDIPARRPFTDITNQDRTVKRKRRETRDKSRTKNTRIENAELKEYSRNLFEEEFIHGGITTGIVYDENCEETRFQECGDTLFDSDNSNDDYVDPISEDSSSGESDIENSNCNLPQRKKRTSHASRYVIPEEYATLGAPSRICSHCNAQMWHEERVNKCVTKGKPLFSICCRRGEVKLPEPEATPNYLLNLYRDDVRGSKFERSIRLYNAMFAFTSAGGNVDHSINRGRGPYIYTA
ncbi:uncharacterized protein LOC108202265 [Daucus carota subsp. sativus]|uniref:uncharacterized protein LOC108202265 n=1 Tax=Daucus carota subsp. sativus TaxID=79200 RepID=UPI0030828059